MAMAFFVGKYLADENSAVDYKVLKDSIFNYKNHVKELHDSLNTLKQLNETMNGHKQLPPSNKKIKVKSKVKAISETAY